ncbi:MAG: hypothetical protein ACKPKO_11815, partial [Candidatus Fonsibacter sp.]
FKTQEIKSLGKSLAELSAEKESADTEHVVVVEYYAKIKDRCIAKLETCEGSTVKRLGKARKDDPTQKFLQRRRTSSSLVRRQWRFPGLSSPRSGVAAHGDCDAPLTYRLF